VVDEIPQSPIRGGCPELEAIAACVDGRLAGPEKAEMEAHLASCDDCFAIFSETARSEAELGKPEAPAAVVRPRFGRRWIVLAAAAALVAAAIPLAVNFRTRRRVRPDVAELVAAVGAQRPFEPRLTGGFQFGPMAPRYRSAKPLSESDSWEVLAAAAKIRKKDEERSTPATLDALGAANLILGKYDDAVSNLEEATLEEPKNARYLTDLSAAYLVRAKERDRADDYPKALEAAEKATELDPSILEAWFNRALALDELPLKSEAAKAWKDYLARDAKSGWADEARRRLAAIAAIPNHAEEWKKAKPGMLAAAMAGDARAVRSLAQPFVQETRELVETEVLPEWARAFAGERTEAAARLLSAASVMASAQSALGGDSMLEREVEGVSRAFAAGEHGRLALLASGIGDASAGRDLYRRFEGDLGMTRFRQAEDDLGKAGNPLALWAAVDAAACDYYGGRLSEAGTRLEALRRRAKQENFSVLEGRAELWLGLIAAQTGRPAASGRRYLAALACFERSREMPNVASAESMIAEHMDDLGSSRQAWKHRSRALAVAGDAVEPRLRHVALSLSVFALMKSGQYRAAQDFQAAVLDAAERWGSPVAIESAHRYRAEILSETGRSAEAEEELARCRASLGRIDGATMRDREAAEASLTQGKIELASRAAAAEAALSRAATYYRQQHAATRLPEVLLFRGRAYRRTGDFELAARDFDAGIRLVEEQRDRSLDDDLRISYFEQAASLFQEMIRVEAIDRRKPDAALGLAERDRARDLLDAVAGRSAAEPLTIPAISGAVPEGTALVYYESLEDRLLSWVLKRDGWHEWELLIPRGRLDGQIRRYRKMLERDAPAEALQGAASALYDELIRPVESSVSGGETLVFLPGGSSLGEIPFASLYDRLRHRYLIEDHAVALAPSGTTFALASGRLRARPPAAALSALVVAEPRPDPVEAPDLRALPGAGEEARRIAAIYPGARVLADSLATKERFREAAANAAIIHFAGHSVVNRDDPFRSRLVLAPDPESGEPGSLLAREIYDWRLASTRLVVLAACSTGDGPAVSGEGVLSLARPFLAAGVPDVVATLWSADDAAAGHLLEEFHRRVREGADPAAALRAAQRQALEGPDRAGRSPARWAAYEVIGAAGMGRLPKEEGS